MISLCASVLVRSDETTQPEEREMIKDGVFWFERDKMTIALTTRLRASASGDRTYIGETLTEAADAIEALTAERDTARAEITRLRANLEADRIRSARDHLAATAAAAWLSVANVSALPARISPHTAYADFLVTFEVETEQDALEMIERLNPISATNSTTYAGSFVPLDQFDARSKGRHGEARDTAPYWAKIEDRSVEFHCYVSGPDGHVGDVAVKILKPEMRVTARRVEFRGGFRYEDRALVDPASRFVHRVRMWSSPEYIGGFVAY